MTQTSRPFAFDTEFSDTGAVLTASTFRPIKRAYAPAEVDVLVSQARLESREAALAEIESMRAMALSTIAQDTMKAGRLMVSKLLDSAGDSAGRSERIPTDLIVRETCGG